MPWCGGVSYAEDRLANRFVSRYTPKLFAQRRMSLLSLRAACLFVYHDICAMTAILPFLSAFSFSSARRFSCYMPGREGGDELVTWWRPVLQKPVSQDLSPKTSLSVR